MVDARSLDHTCRQSYVSLLARAYREGLAEEVLQNSRSNLCELRDDRCFLRNIAYQPTGIALGRPLPDATVTARLAEITRQFRVYLDEMLETPDPQAFAQVPPDWYHITLVNQSHYADGADTVTRRAQPPAIQQQIRDLLSTVGPITVQLDRVILTAHGIFMVACYPLGATFFELRQTIVNQIPVLATNTPRTAHMKLGHLQTMLSRAQLHALLKVVCQIGQLDAELQFTQVYTPSGRLSMIG